MRGLACVKPGLSPKRRGGSRAVVCAEALGATDQRFADDFIIVRHLPRRIVLHRSPSTFDTRHNQDTAGESFSLLPLKNLLFLCCQFHKCREVSALSFKEARHRSRTHISERSIRWKSSTAASSTRHRLLMEPLAMVPLLAFPHRSAGAVSCFPDQLRSAV